ncbi:hypothetical protein ANTQUA_LOCUS3439 [Anthophora quadrimaculata]
MSGFTSLRAAVTRALEMEAVEAMTVRGSGGDAVPHSKPFVSSEGPPEKKRRQDKTCWTCGGVGHFQWDCRKTVAKKKQGNGKRTA